MYFGYCAHIHAAGRLIEDDQFWILNQSLGDDHLLLIASREFDDPRISAQRANVELLAPMRGKRLRFASARKYPARFVARNLSDINIVCDGHRFEYSVPFSILRNIDDAIANCRAWRTVAHGSATQAHVAAMKCVTLDDSGDDPRRLRPARAHKAED